MFPSYTWQYVWGGSLDSGYWTCMHNDSNYKVKLEYGIIFSVYFFVLWHLKKPKEGSFYKITSKLLWLSSQNGSCSFLYQLSDLYLASLQKQSLSSQLVWSSRFWIRSLPLKGLMFPVLSHGFTKSWGKGGVLLGCTGAMLNYKTGYRSGVVIITHKKN